jgi:hypothetical protein
LRVSRDYFRLKKETREKSFIPQVSSEFTQKESGGRLSPPPPEIYICIGRFKKISFAHIRYLAPEI